MWARIALAAALGFGCDGGGSEPDASDAAAIVDGASMGDAGAGGPCQAFEGPTELGRIDDPGLTELSGLAASRRHPGLFYAHNDSGDVARVYVLDASASVVGRIALTGAAHVDYEDIAVGPGPDGEPWVHVGDVGDNAARDGRGTPRDAIAVYRFPEPDDPPRGDLEVGVDTLTLRYPETAHDCEALAVEADGSLLLLTKEDVGPSVLFRASPSSPDVLEALTTLNVGGPDVPGSRNVTAMDLSPGARSSSAATTACTSSRARKASAGPTRSAARPCPSRRAWSDRERRSRGGRTVARTSRRARAKARRSTSTRPPRPAASHPESRQAAEAPHPCPCPRILGHGEPGIGARDGSLHRKPSLSACLLADLAQR
ncbi:MAG: hypothetical protein EVA89_13360 [Sandaracinaceae bacterium]|nr:MAG: hypothetical protein EVA89_13360 [Sandaracinaceae bacterium]